MSFTEKFNAEMSNITKIMKNGVDNCKLEGKIAEQQMKIKSLIKEIGNLALVRLDEGDEMCPEIMERYSAIKVARETIEALKKEKKTTKVVCPSCGEKTFSDMSYCGKCGASLKEKL